MIRYLSRRIIGGCLVSSLVLASGCTRDWQSQPVSMWNESRYKPLSESKFFPNGSSSQPLVPGTVARGQLRADDAMYTGRAKGQLVNTFPFAMTDKDLARGQERFNIYCSPCHSKAGDGQGMIVKRGFATPPDYHIARLMNAPVGHFYDVITNGYGVMYSYASRVAPEDRWRIAAYIRVLQHTTKPAPWSVNSAGRIQEGATPSPNSIGISNMPGTTSEAGVAPGSAAPNAPANGTNNQPLSPAGSPHSGQPGADRSRSTIPPASPVTGGTGDSKADTAPVKVRR